MLKNMKWLILLLMFVLASPIVYGQTSLFSTKVNESLKKQLDINGKWNFLLFADGSTQSTAYTGIGGGDVIGPSASIDSEIAIYNSTTGKLLKRFAGTGIVTATSGVIGTATTTGTGAVVLATSPTVQTPTISDGAIFNLLSNNNITIDASTNPRIVTTGVVRINHTPGMVGTRPFTLSIDAAGFGDTHTIATDFTATGIGAGEQNHLFDINVNTADSTGGEVNGLSMAKTGTGAIDCNAVEVYPGVDVISQRTGAETSIEQAFSYNGAYTDITSNLSSAASDVQLFVANGDIVYIGNAGTFNSLAVTLAVAASGAGIKPTFEYSAGASSWTTFSPTDGTNGFRNLGGTIAWGALAGWATDTVNAVGSKYWVRITRTQNTLTTPPTEDLIKYIASVNYGWDKDGDISSATLNGLTCTPQTNGFTIAGGTTSKTLTVPLDASVSGTNTGDNATNTQYSSLVSNATHTGDVLGGTSTTVVGINGTLMSGLATGIVKNSTTTGVPSIAVAGDFPTLNQSTTGTAANVTGIVAVVNGGSGTNTATGTGAIVLADSPIISTQISVPSIISAGALGITPASGSNVSFNLAGTGDFVVNTSQLYLDTSSGNFGIGTSTPSNFVSVNAGNGVYIDTAGRVGIGMVPNTLLNVSGVQSNVIARFIVDDSTAYNSSNLLSGGRTLRFGNSNLSSAFASMEFYAGNNGFAVIGVDATANPTQPDIVFGTGATVTEKMRITYLGNLGIGTTTANNIITCPIASTTDPIADAWTVHCLSDYKDIDMSIDAITLGVEALGKVKASKVSKFKKRATVDRADVEKSMKEIFKKGIRSKIEKDLEDYTVATGVKIVDESYINETLDSLWETKDGKDALVDVKKAEEESVKKLLPKFTRVNYGLVVEDAPSEAQVYDVDGRLQGVDPYALIGILWAAVQSQERRLTLLENK